MSLSIIINSPWYVNNQSLYNDLKIITIPDQASKLYIRFHIKLQHHLNPLISNLSSSLTRHVVYKGNGPETSYSKIKNKQQSL